MQGLFFVHDEGVHLVSRVLVAIVGLWIAWRAGKAVSEKQNNYLTVIVYAALIAGVMQFAHYALFEGPVLSVRYYSIDFILLLTCSTASYRYPRSRTARPSPKFCP